MSTRFISTVLTVSMSVTALVPLTATPAMADTVRREDAAKLLMGAAALAIVGTAIAHKQDRKDAPPRKAAPDRHAGTGSLPRSCLVDLRRDGKAYDAACLARKGVHVRALPKTCEMNLRTRHGISRGYGADCLSRSFYRPDPFHRRAHETPHRNDANRYLPRPYQRDYGQRYIVRPGH